MFLMSRKKSVSRSVRSKSGFTKKIVTVLVIIAIVLACFAVVFHYFDLGKKISTTAPGTGSAEDSSGGKVGVVILPPSVEDRGAG